MLGIDCIMLTESSCNTRITRTQNVRATFWTILLLLSLVDSFHCPTRTTTSRWPSNTRRTSTATSLRLANVTAEVTATPLRKKRARVDTVLSDRLFLNHEILTREQEQELAYAIQSAQNMRERVQSILVQQQQQQQTSDNDGPGDEELSYWSAYGIVSPDVDNDEEHINTRGRLMQHHETKSLLPAEWKTIKEAKWDALEELSDQEILAHLDVTRNQLQEILQKGAVARDTLMRCNVRLVVSIAKRWAKQSVKGSSDTRSSIYTGGWDRPSLDEAIQEGILGLAQAADRFEPQRGLRFTTYATYWVTSYVRQCFQNASTGCLRIPVNILDSKTKYRRLVKEYIQSEGEMPSIETMANKMGITVERLDFILRKTRPLASIDAPLRSGVKTNAGKSGTDTGNENDLLISDTLVDDEILPEDRIDLSFLRQSLENAMATELAPHERDILRLRLGLDDGVSRTVPQVAKECGGALTVSEIRSAEKRAFRKLRSPHSLATYKLLAWLDFVGADRSSVTWR